MTNPVIQGSIVATLQSLVNSTKNPALTELEKIEGNGVTSVEITSLDESYSGVTIKKNTAGVPVTGFGMKNLADEVGSLLSNAMHKAGINSIGADTLGLMHMLGIIPRGFKLEVDANINRSFFVLRDSNRSVDVYKQIIQRINSTVHEIVSFPYLIQKAIELPVKFNESKGDFDFTPVKVESLTLTKEEIESLNYTFIKEIKFYKSTGVDAPDLIALHIDREEWKRRPYRTADVPTISS